MDPNRRPCSAEYALTIKRNQEHMILAGDGGIRAVPIAEAMLALVLLDHALRDRAQNIDVLHLATLEED